MMQKNIDDWFPKKDIHLGFFVNKQCFPFDFSTHSLKNTQNIPSPILSVNFFINFFKQLLYFHLTRLRYLSITLMKFLFRYKKYYKNYKWHHIMNLLLSLLVDYYDVIFLGI